MEFLKKFKEREKDIITAVVILLVALISFGLGRLSKIREQKTPIIIENARETALEELGGSTTNNAANGAQNSNLAAIGVGLSKVGLPPVSSTGGKVVASKNGTKYHYPWCSGASKISDKNKVWFASEDEAKKAGYSPASNCKGLK